MTNHFDNKIGALISRGNREDFVYGSDFAYVDFFRYILPVLKDERAGRLLDIGSCSGAIGICLAKLGYRVDGIDDSPVAIATSNTAARSMMLDDRVRFRLSDLAKFSTDRSYDVVLCLDRIEHVIDDEDFLSRVREAMVHDGLLVLSTPLRTAPLTRLGMTVRFDETVGHVRRYGRNRIVATLMRSGFNVDSWVETEGIIRNGLLVNPRTRSLTRYLRGYGLTRIVTAIDDVVGRYSGYSKIILFSRRK